MEPDQNSDDKPSNSPGLGSRKRARALLDDMQNPSAKRHNSDNSNDHTIYTRTEMNVDEMHVGGQPDEQPEIRAIASILRILEHKEYLKQKNLHITSLQQELHTSKSAHLQKNLHIASLKSELDACKSANFAQDLKIAELSDRVARTESDNYTKDITVAKLYERVAIAESDNSSKDRIIAELLDRVARTESDASAKDIEIAKLWVRVVTAESVRDGWRRRFREVNDTAMELREQVIRTDTRTAIERITRIFALQDEVAQERGEKEEAVRELAKLRAALGALAGGKSMKDATIEAGRAGAIEVDE